MGSSKQTIVLPQSNRVRLVVASSVMLTFISFWRAAAIVLNDLGSSAFYAGGLAEAQEKYRMLVAGPKREEIDLALARARSGTSATLALVGEAGIGKTALLEYAAQQATGMQLLRARGIESEAQIPFASLLELLHPIAAEAMLRESVGPHVNSVKNKAPICIAPAPHQGTHFLFDA